MIRFQLEQLVEQGVVFHIRYLGVVKNVVAVIVVVDQRTELLQPCFNVHALFDIRRLEKSKILWR